MSRKGENIYKRKDGRWEGRYKKGVASNSRTIYGSCYGKTYREVKKSSRTANGKCRKAWAAKSCSAHIAMNGLLSIKTMLRNQHL